MTLDKNKAYRFRGDSERWEYVTTCWTNDKVSMTRQAAEHLHERGILLEYPELPGEDWEFCEREQQEKWLQEASNSWNESKDDLHCPTGIYCRKKKPVYESGYCHALAIGVDADVYWTTDPEKGKELLS